MGLALRDQQRHTYREYCTWPEDVRYELIDGQAYAMSPGPSRRHQEIGFEVARQVADALEGTGCRVYVAPFDVRLPRSNEVDDDIDTVVQPDLMVVCDRAKLDDRGCRGAPDWVIEVLSPSSAGHDQILKRAVYERHGVKEYWLIHPVDQVVTVYRFVDGAYGKPDIYELKDTLACGILPEVVIDWARVLREE
jgi:Uma2 family endonuclease